ncbi:hypothetical protein [Spirosoma arcticum]
MKPEMNTLQEGIKNKYRQYHLTDPMQFPDLEYNTNRANYEPLRASFENEFYVVRGIDRINLNIHIPSTNTLSLIFTDDSYVPSKKIFNTCRSYAESKEKVAVNGAVPATNPLEARPSLVARRIVLAGFMLMTGLIGYAAVQYLRSATSVSDILTKPASGLLIDRPTYNRIVPRELLTGGKVSGADTVWIVVRAVGSVRYWVQPPIKVRDDSTWRGATYIGSEDKGDIGVKFQIRAFVNPANVLKDGDVLHSWPEAELSTKAVVIIRGAQNE